MLKSPKTNATDGLIQRTSSMLDEIESKTVHKDKVIHRGKRSKTPSEVKPVKNVTKNLQSFLEISPVQKDVLSSCNLQNHAYEKQNPFRLKEDNHQEKLSHPCLSLVEPECHTNLIQEKIHIQQNLNEDLKCL